MKKIILALLIVLLLSFTLIGNCAWLPGYDQRIKLTIDNTKIDSALSDFPATVFFTSTQGEEIFAEFDADSDYMKCAFTTDNGETQLYAEKEKFTVYGSQYPLSHDGTYVKATTTAGANFYPYFATNPAKSLTGTAANNSWRSALENNSEQRFHIDLGSAEIVVKIYYENNHATGASTDIGVQNFTFWGSNTAESFVELTYATDTGWTQLTTSQPTFDEHSEADEADPKYITVTNATAYRYYAFKFADNYGDNSYMGVRRIELQANEVVYHVKVTSVASGADTDIYYYYDNDHADNTNYIGAIDTTAGGNVWDDSFVMVQHMVDATTSTIKDSTSNDNDGTKTAANNPNEIPGDIGKSQDFGGDDYIDVNHSAELSANDYFTVEMMMIPDIADTDQYLLIKADDLATVDDDLSYRLLINITNKIIFGVSQTGEYNDEEHGTSTGALSTDTLYYIAGKNDGTNISVFIDDAEDNTASALTVYDSTSDVHIGARYDLSEEIYKYFFDGKKDEIRVSNIARADAWMNATCDSLKDNLLTYGSEEAEEEEVNAIFWFNF